MLGGNDTCASVFQSRSGGDTDVATASASASGSRSGNNEAAAIGNMFDSNGNSNNNSGEVDKVGGRSFGGGNRWPRNETLALLKIRSDMDVTFREANVKGPLWDEVSRKLAEIGYNRNAKKCKEKFENVYKYHKRTKDGKTGKSDGGKTYRFFDQLEAFQSQPSIQLPPPPQQLNPAMEVATNPPSVLQVNVGLQNINPTSQSISPPQPVSPTIPSFPNVSADLMSNSTSNPTSSDVGLEDRKKKRKLEDFFERLMKEVVKKQEEMQKKFLETIEKRELERKVREEAWRMQEMSRLNREREILAHERSITAAKDEAVIAFLQNLSEQQNPGQAPPQQQQQAQQALLKLVSTMTSTELSAADASITPAPAFSTPMLSMPVSRVNYVNADNEDQSYTPSSSRWPKVEIEALIKIRTNLDSKYQDNGPKGPLWEEISSAMKRLGYNRNAKRCKEKWENINKYYKKVKESNKQRPEDSKTCPYFHQLDALYKEKNKHVDSSSRPENPVPLMVRPEQQWPPPSSEPDRHQHDNHVMEGDMENQDEDEDEEDDGGSYEIVASKQVSMGT